MKPKNVVTTKKYIYLYLIYDCSLDNIVKLHYINATSGHVKYDVFVLYRVIRNQWTGKIYFLFMSVVCYTYQNSIIVVLLRRYDPFPIISFGHSVYVPFILHWKTVLGSTPLLGHTPNCSSLEFARRVLTNKIHPRIKGSFLSGCGNLNTTMMCWSRSKFISL